MLQSAFLNKWPDPAQENFDRKYIIEYSRAMAYKEIFNLIEGAEKMAQVTAKQLKEPEKNYGL